MNTNKIDRTDQSIAQNRFRAGVLCDVDAISDQSFNVVKIINVRSSYLTPDYVTNDYM